MKKKFHNMGAVLIFSTEGGVLSLAGKAALFWQSIVREEQVLDTERALVVVKQATLLKDSDKRSFVDTVTPALTTFYQSEQCDLRWLWNALAIAGANTELCDNILEQVLEHQPDVFSKVTTLSKGITIFRDQAPTYFFDEDNLIKAIGYTAKYNHQLPAKIVLQLLLEPMVLPCYFADKEGINLVSEFLFNSGLVYHQPNDCLTVINYLKQIPSLVSDNPRYTLSHRLGYLFSITNKLDTHQEVKDDSQLPFDLAEQVLTTGNAVVAKSVLNSLKIMMEMIIKNSAQQQTKMGSQTGFLPS